MNDELLSHAFGVIGQTIFLFFALWIMIKLQKLQYHLLGLIGASLLACLLDCIPYVGIYVSVSVLLFCITKVIGSRTITDALFTVGIAYAITFCFNLFVLATLIGDLTSHLHLQARARNGTKHALEQSSNEMDTAADDTNTPPAANTVADPATDRAVARSASPAAPPVVNATPTPAPAAPVPTPAAATPPPALPLSPPAVASVPPPVTGLSADAGKAAADVQKRFVIKGISRGASETIVLVGNGTKTWDFSPGEMHSVDTAVGKATMKCESADESKAVFIVEGVRVTLVH